MLNDVSNRIKILAEPILFDEGMELVDVEYRRETNGWVLRLIVDKEGGVSLDDCSRVSQTVGRMLDVEDFIESPYHLEVSSPGLDRPLKSEKDFLKYRNRKIRVKTSTPILDRRQFKGKLLGVTGDGIQLQIDGEIVSIPLSSVAKANLEVEL
jgi:ribosome maturation factor RimP